MRKKVRFEYTADDSCQEKKWVDVESKEFKEYFLKKEIAKKEAAKNEDCKTNR